MSFDGLSMFGFSSWPEPPDEVVLSILGLSERPSNQDAIADAFRVRLRAVHPDTGGFSMIPGAERAVLAHAVLERPDVAAVVWARDVLLRKVPPTVTAEPVTPWHPATRNARRCVACNGERISPRTGEPYDLAWGVRVLKGYCYPCRADAQRERRRAERLTARADRVCESCGETFTPARSDGRYCTPACRQAAYRERQIRTDNDNEVSAS